MDDVQENKLSMYEVVLPYLDKNQTVWEGAEEFVNAVAELRKEVEGIRALEQLQKQSSKGATTKKADLRTAMGSAAMTLVGALKAMASVTKNPELGAQVDYSLSDFTGGRDTLAANKADIVYNQAAPHAAALLRYGVEAGDLPKLRAAIDAYRASLPGPRETINTSSEATEQLEAAFGRVDLLLKDRLDNLVNVYRSTQTAFASGYDRARQIIDNRGGRGGGPSAPPAPSAA